MDTNSGLQISEFPQEGLPPSYPVCSVLFLPKISVGNPSVSKDDDIIMPFNTMASFNIITGNIATNFFENSKNFILKIILFNRLWCFSYF